MALSLFGVSCSNNSTKPNDNNSSTGTGGGSSTTEKEVGKTELLGALKAIGAIGKEGANESGKYDFSSIKDIAAEISLTATGATTSTSKSKTKTLFEGAFAGLAAKGFSVAVNASAIESANGATAANVVLTITPAANYKFKEDLTSIITGGTLTLKLTPTSDANWGE